MYTSAVIFSPAESLIRQLFSQEEPDWIVLKTRLRPGWDEYLQTISGHDKWVTSVIFSADGKRLASSSSDKTVKIWDSISGECLQTLSGHDNKVYSVAFSANGERLASSSYDKTVKIWDSTSGECLRTLLGHDALVTSVAFSANGKQLASSSFDKTVKIWDSTSGECIQTFLGHDDLVGSVVFLTDSKRLASSSYNRIVKIWDATSGECLRTLSVGFIGLHLLSDPTNNSRLHTEIGTLELALPSAGAIQPMDNPSSPDFNRSGYGISTGHLWIINGTDQILRLPQACRTGISAVAGSTIAIGCENGSVLLLELR